MLVFKMNTVETYIFLVINLFGFSLGALKLSPALNETERYVNDSYVVTCFGDKATGAKWIGPENVPIPAVVGRIHTEEKSDYISLIFEYILRNDSGNYICSNGNEKISFKLTVVKPIKFRAGLEEQHIVVGGSDQVKCEAEGSPQPTLMWHVNGSVATGRRYTLLPTALHIMNVTRDDRGIYLCRAYQVTSQTSIVMDQIINVNVHYKPAWKPWQDWYGYIGGIANLTCEVEAEPPAKFNWTQNNQTIEGAKIITEPNRSVLQINVTDETVFGTYECRAWNYLGKIKKSGELRQGAKPEPPFKVHIDTNGPASDGIKLVASWQQDNDHLGIRVEYLEFDKFSGSWENASYKDFYDKNGPYQLTDLKANTKYLIRVATLGLAGLSDFAQESNFITSSCTVLFSNYLYTLSLLCFSIFNHFHW